MTFTLWFMGRPSSGKSTLAKQTESFLMKHEFQVENLDGDELRQHIHPNLGFSREDRATNNRRTAFICKLLNRTGIAVVNAMITPFRDAQNRAREIVEEEGTFVLVYVKCSIEECERRDPKGLYEKARMGKIEKFTGVNHPFQEPYNPDIVVDTEDQTVEESLDYIRTRLAELDLLEFDSNTDLGIDHSRQQEVEERLRDMGYLDE